VGGYQLYFHRNMAQKFAQKHRHTDTDTHTHTHSLSLSLALSHTFSLRLCVLGVHEWEGINSIPAEMWLLPFWFPFHPGTSAEYIVFFLNMYVPCTNELLPRKCGCCPFGFHYPQGTCSLSSRIILAGIDFGGKCGCCPFGFHYTQGTCSLFYL